MTTTFEDAKIGERAWSTLEGWGEVYRIDDNSSYPIVIKYDSGQYDTFTYDGYMTKTDKTRSLFWDEVKIKAPKKPLSDLEKDAKVFVWDDPNMKTNRHFSHFNDNGEICVFIQGCTSFTSKGVTRPWKYWELAE